MTLRRWKLQLWWEKFSNQDGQVFRKNDISNHDFTYLEKKNETFFRNEIIVTDVIHFSYKLDPNYLVILLVHTPGPPVPATRDKTSKTMVLPGFFKIECGGGNGGTTVMWLSLWRSCLPKIYHGGPVPKRQA